NHLQPHVNRPGAADRLREMLARTAQDHVSGQRSNASALEDIRQRLDGLAAAIVGLTEKLAALDARLERIDERHEDHYDRVSAIEGHLGEQGQGLSSLEDSLLILAEALLCPQGRHAPPPREGP